MSTKGILGGEIIAVVIVIALVWGYSQHKKTVEKVTAEKVTAEKYAATHPPASHRTVEALVLEHECLTPCSSFVGWSYKVRTDGDPIRIKYQGADWFDQPAQGDFQAPKGFQPGESQFVSSVTNNPHVKVWVYKKITVQGGR